LLVEDDPARRRLPAHWRLLTGIMQPLLDTKGFRPAPLGGRDGSRHLDRQRVVFALNDWATNSFRPLFKPQDFAPAEWHWIDSMAMNHHEWEEYLRQIQPRVIVTGWGTRRIPESLFARGETSLQYVCHLTGTVREVVPRGLIEAGIKVSNWGNSISHTIAEHALLLTLAALRCLPRWDDYMANWPQRRALPTRSLRNKRVGLHGFGAVARELIGMLRPFGCEISCYSQGVPAALLREYGLRAAQTLEALFAQSEVLIECEALTGATEGVVNEQVLLRLPAGAAFINVGRGRIVNEEALARVAVERQLLLGIDVFAKEPPPPDSALRRVPGAIFSPHIAGPTADSFAVLWDFAMRNLGLYLRGEEIDALVTLEVYDRST